jgi:hypothetical protein
MRYGKASSNNTESLEGGWRSGNQSQSRACDSSHYKIDMQSNAI